ncbi:hypothetical protein DPMN_118328 [Dreissena polymorpha]|uniref:Uncharacterized protein n=1 Tax=Dreissena polymorpha TaxID=45954 RepID=A0A9D4GGQ5_DREPO|nr:hypothetical protein DPMN_118328 [Dreissena polymorpha]
MRDQNREMKRMLQWLLARSATDDEAMQLPENISLPIGLFEQMDEFEEHLGDGSQIHNCCIVQAFLSNLLSNVVNVIDSSYCIDPKPFL